MADDQKPFLGSIAEQLIDLGGEFIKGGGVRVSVKTNLGPEIPVFNGTESGGLASALGIEAGVVVRDRDGNVLQTFGEPPATDPIKVIALAVLVGLIGFVIVRGVLPR